MHKFAFQTLDTGYYASCWYEFVSLLVAFRFGGINIGAQKYIIRSRQWVHNCCFQTLQALKPDIIVIALFMAGCRNN